MEASLIDGCLFEEGCKSIRVSSALVAVVGDLVFKVKFIIFVII